MAVIEAERRRAHLRLRLAEAEAGREAGFPIAAAHQPVSEPFRNDSGLQTALSLEKGLKSKAPDEYSGDYDDLLLPALGKRRLLGSVSTVILLFALSLGVMTYQ